MKVIITSDGTLALSLTMSDNAIISKTTATSPVTARELVQALSDQYTANLEQDARDLMAYLESGEKNDDTSV